MTITHTDLPTELFGEFLQMLQLVREPDSEGQQKEGTGLMAGCEGCWNVEQQSGYTERYLDPRHGGQAARCEVCAGR